MNRGRSHYGWESFICNVAPPWLRSTATIRGMNADETQRLLRLAAHIIGAICHSPIGTRHDLGNFLG
jgi:hypothetical protein